MAVPRWNGHVGSCGLVYTITKNALAGKAEPHATGYQGLAEAYVPSVNSVQRERVFVSRRGALAFLEAVEAVGDFPALPDRLEPLVPAEAVFLFFAERAVPFVFSGCGFARLGPAFFAGGFGAVPISSDISNPKISARLSSARVFPFAGPSLDRGIPEPALAMSSS